MHTKTLLAFLVGILVVIGIAYYILPRQQSSQQLSAASEVPPMTAEMHAALSVSHGFQYLVSYTDNGFEPRSLTIKKGETVRFTNNSSAELHIVADGSSPKGSSPCGTSALDSCIGLTPNEFWEFTFTDSGTWQYKNEGGNAGATIVVR